MSNVNIRGAVQNIRAGTTIYTPIVEMIVNGIEAIELAEICDGVVTVAVHRSLQTDLEGDSKILDISVSDNGMGFTDKNRTSFDTLFSDLKLSKGGKGFGRFICLKYFENLHVQSVYFDQEFFQRCFKMGKEQDIIVDESVQRTSVTISGTTIKLIGAKTEQLPNKLSTIARGLVEMLLPYFTTEEYICPKIILQEEDGSEVIVLNDYLNSTEAIIQEVQLDKNSFDLRSAHGVKHFRIKVFKLFSPKNRVSKVSLVAHKREVTDISLQRYVPEFADEFVDVHVDADGKKRNFILKCYVFSDYLDEHVSLERGAFNFQKESDAIYGISQNEIEAQAAELTKNAVVDQVVSRQEIKRERIQDYVEERAPWHRSLLKEMDISTFPMSPSDAEIESLLNQEKFKQEVAVRGEVAALLKSTDVSEIALKVAAITSKISESSKNDLTHYVASRKQVLDIFRRSLELDEQGKYSSEETVHDVIFPTKSDSLTTSYENHNLWILDERLTFTKYISSDMPLAGGRTQRTDIVAFDRRVAFRAENESSNPVTIFEFKRPGRDDFVNPSSKEDPVQQIVRYVNAIRNNDFKTPVGRKINVESNTPFYGYVVCELSAKVEKWLRDEKNFTPMPDKMGWFTWMPNINLYIEVLSWDKLLKDADMRNRVFFYKLGID